MQFLLRATVTAFALWLTTLIVPGIQVVSFADDVFATVLTYVLVGVIFAIINMTLGILLRVLTFPLYLLTLGLFSIIVNGLLLLAAAGVSGWIGFGLQVDGFWVAVWGALVLGFFSFLLGLFVKRR